MTGTLRVAVAAWKLKNIKSDGKFFGHFHDLVTQAHEEGAEFLVLPENQSLELLHLAPDLEEKDVPEFIAQFAAEIEAWIQRISAISGMTIVGGSYLAKSSEGYQNVCPVAHPTEGLRRVIKNRLTTYEKEIWRLVPGESLTKLPDERLGTLICYDSEFPEAARTLCESGVQVLAIPAFTETIRGYHRVRWCAQARAIENQIYVLHSSLVGRLYREPVPETYGNAAIIAPSVEPFPENSVLLESRPGEEAVLTRTLDFDQLAEARAKGDVRNWEDRHPQVWKLS